MNNQSRTLRGIQILFRLIERLAAQAQGKGYGSATIKQEVRLVHNFFQTPPLLAVDIGGNIGEYSSELRRRNPDLELHIFEPASTNIQKLDLRFRNDEKTTILPLAVSEKSGTATLFSNLSGSGLASLTKRNLSHFNISFNIEEAINTIRFEDYWTNNLNKRQIDLVKIDIEGFELSALNGFGAAIQSTNLIQFEFGGCNIDTKTYFQDFWYFFKNHDFELYRITPLGAHHIERYRESDEFFSTTNYIAVNKKMTK